MEKIVHLGYVKRTLENWAISDFPRSLSISKTFNAQPFTEKKIKKFTLIYIILPSIDFNYLQ